MKSGRLHRERGWKTTSSGIQSMERSNPTDLGVHSKGGLTTHRHAGLPLLHSGAPRSARWAGGAQVILTQLCSGVLEHLGSSGDWPVCSSSKD
eukprot:scaffold179942_cov18-Tisochrysis_lutea.AAC.2